ncbi:hypothetical protein OIDMADRAFT_142974 [Oidiodendron maius Zn]|uniref:Uncharacterized protein n=1 Tax=Oidiodendron maius (strain Zn) TaxID=913774 RepID=A0A0C3D231_OIDMZ|nr:hypothetical protein OIDMADRAFT_142974 [Oidiodendron maius Zn]
MDSKLDTELLQSTERYWTMYRESIAKEASQGNENTLDISISSAIFASGTRYMHPLLLDLEIHAFWYTFIEAAKNFTCDSSKQDTLVRQILYVKEIGTVTAKTQATDAILRTSNDQKVWSDLPYLATDLEKACADDSMSATHRTNLHSFIARLASVGICGNTLTGCALLLLRDAFETPSGDAKVPIGDLLPAISMWALYAPHKLAFILKHSSNDGLDPKVLALGKLCREAGVTSGGWSTLRWAFWEKQVEAIAKSDQRELALEASTLLDMMVMIDNDNKLAD